MSQIIAINTNAAYCFTTQAGIFHCQYGNSITYRTNNGKIITLSERSAGVKTGYAFVGNPYYDCPEETEWRHKDGETCIECDADHPRALPVADAYELLYGIWEDERAEFDEWEQRLIWEDEQYAAIQAEKAYLKSDEHYYDQLTDQLLGFAP